MSEIRKIEDLNPASKGIDLLVKVLEINPAKEVSTRDGKKHNVAEVLVGDDTGCVLMSLWDDNINKVQVGQTISIKNAYITLFKGSMRLNIGRYGSLEPSSEEVTEVNTENNISNRSYNQQIPKFRPLYRNDYKKSRRRR
ncbi:MAG: hypothetical protein NZ922_04485 [Candidatus Methanomethyliaceae archaeon]|nr:hypothetical protein [Candidatus Methanomethyliaceae archaeon]MDW7971318.1 single-stranded DNA-binding protein [Nitrososphaerota archaeon]